MEGRAFDVGPIRPPSEANSLLLQVTKGCTWNKCRFCVVYRGQNFRIIQPDDIKRNIDNMVYFRDLLKEAEDSEGRVRKDLLYRKMQGLSQEELNCLYMVWNWQAHGGHNVFLQDGNSIALKPEKLADVLFYLREKFPEIQRITTYGRAETLSRYSVEQLKLLRESGLNRIHVGFESGSDRVLQMINKGLTQEQQIDAGKKVREAGMELSMYFMPGIGGRALSRENAEQTAFVVDQVQPDFVRLRTFVLKLESEMQDMLLRGEFEECTDIGKLEEIRMLIDGIASPDVYLASDHIVNLIGSLNGRLGDSKQEMLDEIDRVLSLPVEEQRTYQLARRNGIVENYEQLLRLPVRRINHLREVAMSYDEDGLWENHLNEILRMYV